MQHDGNRYKIGRGDSTWLEEVRKYLPRGQYWVHLLDQCQRRRPVNVIREVQMGDNKEAHIQRGLLEHRLLPLMFGNGGSSLTLRRSTRKAIIECIVEGIVHGCEG